uniref:Uncharacterized protein n=1 Tax=Arundo donax TaxID=35708 RepID=A0A0A9PX86_ARUDO
MGSFTSPKCSEDHEFKQ